VPLNNEQLQLLANLGANIRRRRVEIKMTQEHLAELAGINPRTIQKIEAGQLNILVTTFARIQEALECSWDDLMTGGKVKGRIKEKK
jgi:transcriptional regulator with XRE-family HTH domain